MSAMFLGQHERRLPFIIPCVGRRKSQQTTNNLSLRAAIEEIAAYLPSLWRSGKKEFTQSTLSHNRPTPLERAAKRTWRGAAAFWRVDGARDPRLTEIA